MLKNQAAIALIGLAAMEIPFAAMAHLGDMKLHVIETIVLALAAGILYCFALYALEHSPENRAAFWLILAGALLFRLTLAPLPPSLSTDMYRYRWDGRVQNAGWNPYAIAPLDQRLAPLRDPTWAGMPGPEVPAIYPPLAELIFRETARFTHSPVAFKTPFVLADLLVVAMLAGWLRSSRARNYQLAVYAWSPLVIVEFAGSGHSDALAIAFLVAALAIIRRRPGVSTLTMAAGALTKLFPVTLLPLAVRLAGWPRRWRGWLAAAGTVGLAAMLAWPYRYAYTQLPRTFSYYRRIWQNYNPSLYGVLLWLTGRPAIAAGIGEGVVLALSLWAAWRKIEPVRAAFLVIGAILMFAPNGYSWYFTWIVPLLCFFPSPAWLLLTVLQFLSYNVLIAYQLTGEFRFAPLFQWLTYAPFYALLAWELISRRGAFGRAPRGEAEGNTRSSVVAESQT